MVGTMPYTAFVLNFFREWRFDCLWKDFDRRPPGTLQASTSDGDIFQIGLERMTRALRVLTTDCAQATFDSNFGGNIDPSPGLFY